MKVGLDRRIPTALVAAAFSVLVAACGAPSINPNAANQANVNANSNASKAATTDPSLRSSTCVSADDRQIESQIKISIRDTPELLPHRLHINASSSNCNVILRGHVNVWGEFQILYDKVINAGGVRTVDISHFELSPSKDGKKRECGAGEKPCGEICIGEKETCIIDSVVPTPTPTPTPTAPPKP